MKHGLAKLRRAAAELFPERHLYVRSGGSMRAYVLSPKTQMLLAGGVGAAGLWMGVCTAAMLVQTFSASAKDREIARTQAKYERWIADRQARLNVAMAQLDAGGESAQRLAAAVEKRHAALALLLSDIKGLSGAAPVVKPAASGATPVARLEMVQLSQDQLLTAADAYAKSRADRLRLAFRLAGLAPSAYARPGAAGGPLIEGSDPRALAAVLDVEPAFAARVQRAAGNLAEMGTLERAAQRLPFGRPTAGEEESSSFGVRADPFTRRPAFHSGLDFPGGRMSPVTATAPGVVAFTGERAGYGRTVEIDHGRGLKTRYGHLAAVSVRVGQQVASGQRIGGMGSTGRSTGTHLHYEVWLNGRPMNPERYLKAGAYARTAG